MTRSLAVDIAPRIRVNAIEPAAIDTEMLRMGFQGRNQLISDLKKFHPTNSIGKALDVAKIALWIIQSDINFMNGATITLDGGISSRLFDHN